MIEDHDEKDIGEIGNYYGSLSVKVLDGIPYWSIENYSGHNWEAIPEYLYHALIRYESSR